MLAILGVLLGITGIFLALRGEAKAAPPEVYIPTSEEIYASQSITKLDTYYELLNELYISGQITYDLYMELYGVYETRFYELVESA